MGNRRLAIPRAGRRLRRAFAAALAASLAPLPAPATDFRVGELQGIFDVSLTYGLLARYELHRVWVVEGVLKPGEKHVYSRRVFYVDEDSWQIAVADLYDDEGRIWRVAESHALNYYEVPVLWKTLDVYHDLKERRYLVSGLDNGRNLPQFAEEGDPREFSPNALAYYTR